jgi:hypothetical protein
MKENIPEIIENTKLIIFKRPLKNFPRLKSKKFNHVCCLNKDKKKGTIISHGKKYKIQ